MILVVDDDRIFPWTVKDKHFIIYERSSRDAIAFMARFWAYFYLIPDNERMHELWLDHDLGNNDTIKLVVDFLLFVHHAGFPFPVDHVHVHSMNASGADKAVKALEGPYDARRVPLPEGTTVVWTGPSRGSE